MSGDLPVYVVLGASGSIGSEVCRRLYATGCRLMMCARHVEKLDTLQADLPDALYFGFFAEHMDDVERCIEQALNMFGRVDGIINCAGLFFLKPAHQTEDQEWQNLAAVNLSASFACVKAAGKLMLADGGSVVLLSSSFAETPTADTDAIAAVSGGINGLVRSAAESLKAFSIRINAVSLGMVNTPASEPYKSSVPDRVPVHEAADAAKVISWLASPENTATGKIITVDEGLSQAG